MMQYKYEELNSRIKTLESLLPTEVVINVLDCFDYNINTYYLRRQYAMELTTEVFKRYESDWSKRI